MECIGEHLYCEWIYIDDFNEILILDEYSCNRTDEHIFEPPEKLELAKEELGVGKDEFVTVFHGQTCVWKEGQDILVKEK